MLWLGRLLRDTLLLIPRSFRGRRPWLVAPLVIPMGVLALLIAFLATVNEVRVILLYWLTDRDSVGPGTWGGPTMAGAWAVHAALGLALLPVFAGILACIRALADRATRHVQGKSQRGWVLPVAVVVDVAAVLVVVAFAHQL